MLSTKCEVCGTEIVLSKSEKRDRIYSKRFCSRKCRSREAYIRRHKYYENYWKNHIKGPTEIVCEICGKKAFVRKSNCKTCSVKCSHKAWKKRNPEKVNEWARNRHREKVTERLSAMPSKKCPFCGKEFHPLQDRLHPYKTYCSSECQVKNSHQVSTKRRNEILKNSSLDPVAYKKHKLRKQVQDCNYKAFSRGCTRDDENHISLKSWLDIKETHGNKCALCGKPESKENEMTIDHIHPISKGGKNNKDNVQPACWRCNSEKGDKIISIPHTSLN